MGTNVPGRTTKEVTELINQQGFDEKYGMVFTEDIVKGAKSRYGFKSGTPMGNPKGYSSKYPEGMAEYVASIAQGKSTAELVEAVNRKYGAGTIGIRQMKAYKRNHGINTGLTGQFEPGHIPANKGKKMSPEQYEKCKATMFRKGNVPANHMEVGEYTQLHVALKSRGWWWNSYQSAYSTYLDRVDKEWIATISTRYAQYI